jgi:hypothetical protein
MESISERLSIIEAKLDKLVPLVDLLDTIIRVNINKTDTLKEDTPNDDTPKEFDANGRDLVYTLKDDNVYIYGTKTYQCRDLIKSSFKDTSWCKEKTSWTFKSFENIETTLSSIFPNIIKDQ